MTEVRPFSEEFATDTAALYFRAMRGQTRHPGNALPAYFSEMLLRNPWADPEIPSLVCVDKGKVIAALGIIPRPMEFRGENIAAATMTQFMVEPEYRRSSAAMQLLRRCFHGPQDMTWVDGASDPVFRFHKIFGSLPAHFYSLHWMRVLRPFATGRTFLTRFGAAGRALHGVAGVATVPADLMATRLSAFGVRRPPVSTRDASAGELFACIDEIGWREPLKPRYDAASFAWLIAEASQATPEAAG